MTEKTNDVTNKSDVCIFKFDEKSLGMRSKAEYAKFWDDNLSPKHRVGTTYDEVGLCKIYDNIESLTGFRPIAFGGIVTGWDYQMYFAYKIAPTLNIWFRIPMRCEYDEE